MTRTTSLKATLLLGLLLVLASVGCGSAVHGRDASMLARWIGKTVEVQFRRDALGLASELPIQPDDGYMNGARISMSGKLVAVGPGSVLIEHVYSEGTTGEGKPFTKPCWVPREVILTITLEP